jgi:macrocin-O-methyltransferase TylF-like protien
VSDELICAKCRYLDLLEKSLANKIYGESEFEMGIQRLLQRLRHPYRTRRGVLNWPVRAHTMIGLRRLRHLRELVEITISEGVPGDYIETGVWRGGACILMRGVLAAYNIRDRRVFCADSFEGLPAPDPARYQADKGDRCHAFAALPVSEEVVRQNFATYGLLDEQVVFVKGLFKNTLQSIASNRFALIRLDGDMYESTMDGLVNLYHKLSEGGFIIIDDYGGLKNCRRAVHDFLDRRGLTPKIHAVDESCAWWRKFEHLDRPTAPM